MRRAATFTAAQMLELELVLAGAWGAPRFDIPERHAGRLLLPRRIDVNEGDDLEVFDPEGTGVATIAVESTRVSDTGGTWVTGPVRADRPLGYLSFGELRAAGSDRVRSAVVVSGSVPESNHEVWRGGADVPIVLVDHGDRSALTRGAAAVTARGRQPIILPSPNRDVRSESDWREALATAARALVADTVTIFDTDRDRGDGVVVLFTGLSGSGKSTLAKRVAERLASEDPRRVTLLDGDEMRQMVSAGLGFSREDRELNVRRIGWVAALVAAHGGVAICAPIAPYSSMRAEMRERAEDVGAFVLVHVATPLEVCEQRDRKGLYARARRDEIPQFTGISDPYETPTDPDVVIDTTSIEPEEAADRVIETLAQLAPARRTWDAGAAPEFVI